MLQLSSAFGLLHGEIRNCSQLADENAVGKEYSLVIEENKIKIIDEAETILNMEKADIAKQFDMHLFTVAALLKNGQAIQIISFYQSPTVAPGVPKAVTHPCTNRARRCLTSIGTTAPGVLRFAERPGFGCLIL